MNHQPFYFALESEWDVENEGLAISIYVFGNEWPCYIMEIKFNGSKYIQNGRNGIYNNSHKQPFPSLLFHSGFGSHFFFFCSVEICVSHFITEQNGYNAFSATVLWIVCFRNYIHKNGNFRLINRTVESHHKVGFYFNLHSLFQ